VRLVIQVASDILVMKRVALVSRYHNGSGVDDSAAALIWHGPQEEEHAQ